MRACDASHPGKMKEMVRASVPISWQRLQKLGHQSPRVWVQLAGIDRNIPFIDGAVNALDPPRWVTRDSESVRNPKRVCVIWPQEPRGAPCMAPARSGVRIRGVRACLIITA